MFLDLADQGADLPRHGMSWRFLEKDVQGLNRLFMLSQVDQGLSKHELRGTGRALAFGDCDLRLVACLIVVLLVEVGIGE